MGLERVKSELDGVVRAIRQEDGEAAALTADATDTAVWWPT